MCDFTADADRTRQTLRAIDQVDLKDPVSNAPQFIEIAHGLRIFRRYPRQGLFARYMRMGELADQVTGDLPAEHPACIVGTHLCERVNR